MKVRWLFELREFFDWFLKKKILFIFSICLLKLDIRQYD